jgi:DNA-binding GntR family transcriptional regulator
MDVLLSQAQQAVTDQNRPGFLESAWAHRCACYEAAGRPRLLGIVRGLYGRSGRYHTLTLDVPLRLEESIAFLRAFDRACRAHNGADAAAVVTATLERAAEYIIKNFPSSSGSAA